MNCAIDDEVSRRGRSFEVSPLSSVRLMHPRFMTNHHRIRFVIFTYVVFVIGKRIPVRFRRVTRRRSRGSSASRASSTYRARLELISRRL